MKVGTFLHGEKKLLQIEKKTQVHQLYASVAAADAVDGIECFFNALIRVWNNTGQIVPPMSVRELAVLNGDEYPVQIGVDVATGDYVIVVTYEICDEGSLNRPVYVELDLTGSDIDVELDSIDVKGSTAVSVRLYNYMNIVTPTLLPKNSVCIIKYTDILSLQKNNDLMGVGEILTHSNCILREGTLSETHPIIPVYSSDDSANVPVENLAFSEIAKVFIMGQGSLSDGYVIIRTSEDEFLLSPNPVGGCAVAYCQKSLTKIANNVRSALIADRQLANVDSNEFAAAVAAVGKFAEQNDLPADKTQVAANNVVKLLPSAKIAKLANVMNFNLASEKEVKSGLVKTL